MAIAAISKGQRPTKNQPGISFTHPACLVSNFELSIWNFRNRSQKFLIKSSKC